MTAYTRLLDALSTDGRTVRDRGSSATAQCPAHEDRDPSLSLRQIDGQALLHCHAGCDPRDVLAALGLAMTDLFDEPAGATYRYDDGRVVHRSPDKKFRQSGNTNGRPQLYRAGKVTAAVRDGRTVYLVEGEKDVHALESLGAVATTAPMGAANVTKADLRPLAGAKLVLVPDRDEPGRRWCAELVEALAGITDTFEVRLAAAGKDAADHIAAGHGLDELAPAPADPDAAFEATMRLRREVAHQVHKLRVNDLARRALKAEERVEAPDFVGLQALLADADEDATYRVADLWPVGGRVMLAAQYKAGKSTLTANLVRSLVDGHKFLGRFPVTPIAGRVALIDNELDRRTLRRWLRDQQVTRTDQVAVLSLRGRVGTFDLLDPDVRAGWAKQLREVDASVVILDCLRPVLDALGLSEDKDAGRFLVHFDALLTEAGAGEAVVVHHAGHAGERSRGDSRLRDWPDAEWKLVREAPDEETGVDETNARRYFSALGRDVEIRESLLLYEPSTRWLSLAEGSRKDTAVDRHVITICAYLEKRGGETQNALEKVFDGTGSQPRIPRDKVREALRRAVDTGTLDVTEGSRGARHYTLPLAGGGPVNP